MAHMIATIRIYDVMDQIVVSGLVVDSDADGDSPDRQFHCASTFPGSGESNHRKWLRDALIDLAESL